MSKLLMAGMMLIGLLASCSENDKSPIEKGTPMKLTVTLDSPDMTKAAITDDPTTAAYIASESTINNVVVALFDASGNIVGSPQSFLSTQITSNQVSVTGTSLVTKVAVAANIPQTAFAGVAKLSDFEGKQAVLDSTSTTAGGVTKQAPTKLPMVGEATVSGASTGTATVNVALTRLVSKVTISGIATHFDPNGAYANASFALTEVFMNNVPSTVNCNATSTTSAIVSSPIFLHGEQVTALGLPVAQQKIYLGTGNLTGTVTLPWAGNYKSFYVFPDSTKASQMQLVVKGVFKMNATDTGVTVYYPIILNHGMSGTSFTGTTGSALPDGTDGVILNNKVYSLTVTIAAKGTTDPTKPINTAAVTVNATVAAWPTTTTQSAAY